MRSAQACNSEACSTCRDLESLDDLHFGVHKEMLYAQNNPAVEGAQWTGIVTQIAIEMLESGRVDAVVCVQSDDNDRFKPKPVRTLSKYAHLIRVSFWHMLLWHERQLCCICSCV